jgi:hypothetical protein
LDISLQRLFRVVLVSSIFPWIISCKSLIAIDFDAILDDMVGKTLEQNAPKLVHLQSSHREGKILVNEYWRFNTGVCRWLLFVNAETGVVTEWRYPDKTAAFNCNNFPGSMP